MSPAAITSGVRTPNGNDYGKDLLRQHYEKPSEKRAREKAEAIRRARKLARKKAQREGLL